MEYFGIKIKYAPTQGNVRTYHFIVKVDNVHTAITRAMNELEFDKYEIYTLDIGVMRISNFVEAEQVRLWI